MSKPTPFKRTRDTTNEVQHDPIAVNNFLQEIDNKTPVQEKMTEKKSGKLTTVPLDLEASYILEELSKLEDRSERRICTRLLCNALKAEWEKINRKD